MGEGTRCEDAGVTSIASVTSGHMPRCSYRLKLVGDDGGGKWFALKHT